MVLAWCIASTVLCAQTRPADSAAPDRADVATATQDKRALILVSSGFGSRGSDLYVAELVAGLRVAGLRAVDINVEYLDLVRRSDDKYRQSLKALLLDKYAGVQLDAVVCVQQAALNFLLNEIRDLAPTAPVFSKDARLLPDSLMGAHRFVFQDTQLDYRGTLQRALELFPRTRQVLVLQGSSELELARQDAIRKDLAPWRHRLHIEDTQALSAEEIDARVSTLPEDSIILGVGIARDAKGKVFVPGESNARIVKVAKAPVFVLFDSTLGGGSIGGMVSRLGDEAAGLAKFAGNVLRGERQLTEAVTMAPGVVIPMFDWRQLERWGVDASALPPDTVFINRPVSLWVEHRQSVVAGVLVIALLIGLVVALVFQNRRRSLAEARYRILVEEAPEAILVMDTDLHVAVDANPSAERLFACSRHELVGAGLSRFYLSQQPDGKLREESIRSNVARVMAGESVTTERSIRTSDGHELICDVRMVRLPHAHRNLLRASFIDVTARKRAEQKIHELAFFDQLTGLPNRTLLLDRLKQTIASSGRSGCHAALLLIDLDNFKTLNDTAGHEVGDQLLKQVAERLMFCVREGDTVARFGGDEFVVILAGLSAGKTDAASDIETIAEKIRGAINQPYLLGDIAHNSTASVGITVFKEECSSVDDLIKQGDMAMYKSKEAGRNTSRFFDSQMESTVRQRVALEDDLRRALGEHEFLLHYQAQVVGDGRVTGAEALVRWLHPQRGLVSPAEFIPLAEKTGLILPLGNWVLEMACNQLAAWARSSVMAHLSIAVNVSAHQFHQSNFVDEVLSVLRQSGANPHRLKLELTESTLVSNVEELIEKMFALKAKGVGFSLDDFGTGYSSLSYLKRLPLDQLKIDRSFVQDVLSDPNDAAIAKTIVTLAQSLGLGVTAEGVETGAQRDFLASVGCHAYQGYFFSKPIAVDAFELFAQRDLATP